MVILLLKCLLLLYVVFANDQKIKISLSPQLEQYMTVHRQHVFNQGLFTARQMRTLNKLIKNIDKEKNQKEFSDENGRPKKNERKYDKFQSLRYLVNLK